MPGNTVPSLLCILVLLVSRSISDEPSSPCRDHPRLKEVCQRLPDLKSWCKSKSKSNNVAEVCRASCGLCGTGTKTETDTDTVAQPEEQESKPTTESVKVTTKPPKKPPSGSGSSSGCGTGPDYKPCVPLQEANALLLQCCRDFSLPPECISLCKYNITMQEAQTAVFANGCPWSALANQLYCASRNRDNTDCCEAKSVLEAGGPQCETFCNPTSKDIDSIGREHLSCTGQLENIMKCHWAGIRKLEGTEKPKVIR